MSSILGKCNVGGFCIIAYFGAMKKIDEFHKELAVQNKSINENIASIGFWLTSDIVAAKPYAVGTEMIAVNSETDFWEDGEPKVIHIEKPVIGYIYKVYMHEPHLKIYGSGHDTAFEAFMKERDNYCDYFSKKIKKPTWKDKGILLNKEEANTNFRKSLKKKGYEGFLLQNCTWNNSVTDLYCLFTGDALQIADIISVSQLDREK
ncbi:hypothetical protein [Litchfieldia alkalitelluris]|uniref:hypothetical protein n=2 Tax=Bacillaceae TaxID=186817 RepID=UPI001F17AF0B|nr:hypothetical protein [Litchfieldia alkalitelluris]